MKKIGFIHIPKTGGKDFEKKYRKYNQIYLYNDANLKHELEGAYWKRKGLESFAIIREPFERFISIFLYFTIGSNIETKFEKTQINDINVFIEKMKNYNRHFLISEIFFT